MQYAVWISTAPVCVYSRRFQITIRIRQHDQRACSWREPKDNPVIFLVPPGSSNLGIQVSVFLSSKMGSGWATVVAWRVGEHMSMWSQTLKKNDKSSCSTNCLPANKLRFGSLGLSDLSVPACDCLSRLPAR